MENILTTLTTEQLEYLKKLVQIANKEQIAVVPKEGLINSLMLLDLVLVINDMDSEVSVRVIPNNYQLFKELKRELGEFNDNDKPSIEEESKAEDIWGMIPKSFQIKYQMRKKNSNQ
jgi:arginyl-tRNA--protein-N-Asp/Glu arginylyltransferase